MTILFKLATRSRPEAFFKALDNIIDNVSIEDYFILVSIDKGDATMASPDVLKRIYNNIKYYRVKVCIGNSKSKVEAINDGISNFRGKWDILCNHSDDMQFTKFGFDGIIRQVFENTPHGLDTFMHFPDGFTGDKLCTYSIIGRVYYSRSNYIYHPAYYSLFCDNEATEVAKLLDRYLYVPIDILRHNHVANGVGQKDALLKRNERYWEIDKATYKKRKSINFGI